MVDIKFLKIFLQVSAWETGWETGDDNKNIKISLKAQAHFSGFNDCKHTGKYKILYAFSAFVQ